MPSSSSSIETPRRKRCRNARAWLVALVLFLPALARANDDIDALIATILQSNPSWHRTDALVEKGKRAVGPLLDVATDRERAENERAVAIEALGRLGHDKATGSLRELAASKDTPNGLIPFLDAALALLGDPSFRDARAEELTALARRPFAAAECRARLAEMSYREGAFEAAAEELRLLVADYPTHRRLPLWCGFWACALALAERPHEALRALRLAEAWGADLMWIAADEDLVSLRHRQDFRLMIEAAERRARIDEVDAGPILEDGRATIDVSSLAKETDDRKWIARYLELLGEHPGDTNLGALANGAVGRAVRANSFENLRAALVEGVDRAPGESGSHAIRLALAEKALRDGDEPAARAFLDSLVARNPEPSLLATARAHLFELDSLAIGARAPNVRLEDIEGRPFELHAFEGKIVVCVFWQSSVASSLLELGRLYDMQKALACPDLVLVGISVDEDPVAVARVVGPTALEWPVLCDEKGLQGGIAARYHVTRVPRTFVVDRTGRIAHKDLRGDELHRVVQTLLAERAGEKEASISEGARSVRSTRH